MAYIGVLGGERGKSARYHGVLTDSCKILQEDRIIKVPATIHSFQTIYWAQMIIREYSCF